MKITIERSENWCKFQAIATGIDHHWRIDVFVDPQSLTVEARQVLIELTGTGVFPSAINNIGYYSDLTKTKTVNYKGWGSIPFRIDANHPTAEQISAAIVAAAVEIDAKRDAEIAERHAAEAKLQRIEALKRELAELTS